MHIVVHCCTDRLGYSEDGRKGTKYTVRFLLQFCGLYSSNDCTIDKISGRYINVDILCCGDSKLAAMQQTKQLFYLPLIKTNL